MTWKEEPHQLTRTYTFSSFANAIAWMVKASFEIEKMDHHPEWTNVYNKVQVKLTTHSAGNTVTDHDRRLAARLDEIYSA